MELIALAPSLKRAVAPLGEFDTYFPNSTDDDLSAMLADAVAEAQLDGFLSTVALDSEDYEVTPALTTPQQALVVLYGRARMLNTQIANLKNMTRYKAGNVEAETEQSASVLVELLRETQARKKQLLDDAKYGSAGMAFSMVDLYVAKSIDVSSADIAYLTPGTL